MFIKNNRENKYKEQLLMFWTGIFTQIAILREQAGKPPIGFLNSVLANLNGLNPNNNPLNDITTGESQGTI
jgi:hypothetical protein